MLACELPGANIRRRTQAHQGGADAYGDDGQKNEQVIPAPQPLSNANDQSHAYGDSCNQLHLVSHEEQNQLRESTYQKRNSDTQYSLGSVGNGQICIVRVFSGIHSGSFWRDDMASSSMKWEEPVNVLLVFLMQATSVQHDDPKKSSGVGQSVRGHVKPRRLAHSAQKY